MEASQDNRGRGGIPWRIIGWGTAGALLLLPLVARAPWTAFDYIFAAGMFGVVGGAFEMIVRLTGNIAYRLGVAVALGVSFLLVWVNGAVGIVGSEDNAFNLVYIGEIGVALAGAFAAGLKPQGMARAMLATALMQAGVTAVVWFAALGASEPPGAAGILMLNACFAMPWILAAALFRKAAGEHARVGKREPQ